MKRVYVRYELWEDYLNGMYRGLPVQDESLVAAAVALLSSKKLCLKWMRRVTKQWTISSAVNLSCRSRNRQAWLGQAACCLYAKVPEHLTKQAWHRITDRERERANAAADRVITEWEQTYVETGSGR